MVKIACKCSAGLYVAVIYLQMSHLQSNSSHIYHITSQSTFLPASVTVENHVMSQPLACNYGSMMVQQDGAPLSFNKIAHHDLKKMEYHCRSTRWCTMTAQQEGASLSCNKMAHQDGSRRWGTTVL